MSSDARNQDNHPMNANRIRPSLLLQVHDLWDRESWDEFLELCAPLILRYVGVRRE